MFTHSIRWRLTLWLAFLLGCVLTGFGVTAYQLHRVNQFAQLEQELERRLTAVSADVRGRPPGGERMGRPPFEEGPGHPPRHPPPEGMPFRGPPEGRFGPREVRISDQTAGLFDETDTNGFYFAVWSRGAPESHDAALLKRSTNAPPEIGLPDRLPRDTRTHMRTRGSFSEAYHFTELGECVLVGRSIVADLHSIHRFAGWLVVAGSAVLALGVAGGWRLASNALRPVANITNTATRISAGNLSERISVAETDNELGHLAGVLNSTFARLETAFAQQEQFTADASHELRTPLTVIISEAQTTLARERTAGEYRETVEACLEAAQQMSRLTESLLQLARFDAGRESFARQPFDLAEIAQACVEQISTLAARRGLEIQCDLQPAQALGDANRFGQVVTNLLANAICYNREHGMVRVAASSQNSRAALTVTDNGIGISPEDLPHVFERFYRADKSRARAQGRTGLGLAIAKAIVDAQGGTIEVASEPGKGSVFTVRLPAA